MKLLSLTCVVLGLVVGNAEASVVLNSGWVETYVDDGGLVFDSDIFIGTTIPTSETRTANLGGNSNTTTLDWHQSGGQTIFSIDMQHQRTGDQYTFTDTSQIIKFTATSNSPYELSGFFDATDFGEPGGVMLHAALFDVTIPNAGSTVFQNWQESRNTPNEQFVLGESGGDYDSFVVGSLTGYLIENHEYDFWAASWTYPYPDTDSGASGVGNITLKIGVVPEPSSVTLWGVALLSLCVTRRINRR